HGGGNLLPISGGGGPKPQTDRRDRVRRVRNPDEPRRREDPGRLLDSDQAFKAPDGGRCRGSIRAVRCKRNLWEQQSKESLCRLDVGAAVASAQRAVEDDVALIRSDRDAVDLVELVAGLDQFSGCNMDTRQCSWQAGPQQRRRSRRDRKSVV